MSLQEPKAIYDGFSRINRGMDSGRPPSSIGRDQVAFAINTTFREEYPKHRPGIRRVTLGGDDFQLGRWQGAAGYVATTGRPSVIASIGGQIVQFDLFDMTVNNLSSTSGLENPSIVPKTWFTQAEQFLPIQNGVSIPLIWDGASLRRATPVAFGGVELPVGCMMEYSNGRLAVALPGLTSFVMGDLAYSRTGNASDVLGFTENQFIDGGGEFVMPSDAGFITAMKTVAIMDTTLGQGPLQIFGQKGSASFNAPFDRTQWQNLSSAIQSVSMLAPGPTSQEVTISVNGDLWYRASDGIRSFQIARRDHGTWVNTPLSHEMDRVLEKDDPALTDFASGVDFDNRLLCTVSPYRATTDGVEYGVAWRGLVALDFKPVSSMFDRNQPSWEGVWTGLQILQILKVDCYANERCFVFALNSDNEIELWELSKTDTADNGGTVPIDWTIESRALGFVDNSEYLKQLKRTEQWLQKMTGEVVWEVEYRPDGFWGWLPLDSGSVCATTGMCEGPACGPPQSPQLQYRPRKITSAPALDCEECVDKPYRNGFEFQFKLSVTGSAQLRRFRSVATDLPEQTTGGCLGVETDCCDQSGCEYSPWAYQIEE